MKNAKQLIEVIDRDKKVAEMQAKIDALYGIKQYCDNWIDIYNEQINALINNEVSE